MFPDSKEFSGEDKKNPKNKNQIITKKSGEGPKNQISRKRSTRCTGEPKTCVKDGRQGFGQDLL
jgi:hypothetical protein